MKQFKIISGTVLCPAAASTAVYGVVKRELPLSFERGRIFEVNIEGYSELCSLTESETDELSVGSIFLIFAEKLLRCRSGQKYVGYEEYQGMLLD